MTHAQAWNAVLFALMMHNSINSSHRHIAREAAGLGSPATPCAVGLKGPAVGLRSPRTT